MKKRSKVIIIILALIVLYAIGGAVMLLKSGRPGGGLSAYMEKKYNKEFEIIEEFTYIAYTDGEPETYKTFLEGLEQARGEDNEISEQFLEDKLSTDIGIEEEINFEEEMIINFDDAFGRFEIPSDISRDVVVEEYSDNFPMELQEVLVHLYDDIDEENNADWRKYEADCEIITLETCGDIPFEDIANAADVYSIIDKRSMRIADIDRDGMDEYIINDSIGRGNIGCIYVVKNVDGKWTLIGGGNVRYSTDVCTILEYENRYYLLVGENLSYWSDEVEILNGEYWKHWDSAPWQADCWNSLKLKKEIISYTPYETYNYLQDDSVDYLSDVDLISLENNSAEEESFGIQHWFINGRTSQLEYGWEEEQAGKKYLYVVSTVDEESKDMLLTVLCESGNEKMIVKVYYLVANYNIQFDER